MAFSSFAEVVVFIEILLARFHQICYFQRMVKVPESVKELEDRAAVALRELLAEVPAVRLENVEVEPVAPDRGVDILVHLKVCDRPHMLICEVKSNGQPRNVRAALFQLRNYVDQLGQGAIPMFIAPYLSPEAQAVCKENNVAFLDLVGNARLALDNVFIERRVSQR